MLDIGIRGTSKEHKIVMVAVTQNGMGLYSVSEELRRNNREVAMAAVTQDCLCFISESVEQQGRTKTL